MDLTNEQREAAESRPLHSGQRRAWIWQDADADCPRGPPDRSGVSADEIVVLTFTRRAAVELRDASRRIDCPTRPASGPEPSMRSPIGCCATTANRSATGPSGDQRLLLTTRPN